MALWRGWAVWGLWVVMVWQGTSIRGCWAQLDTCSGQCDCKLSSNEDERAIFNVRTSMCNAGSLQWSSAYGAIRLEVQPFQPNDYRLCFVLHSHHTLTQVSLEEPRFHHLPRNYRLQTSEEPLRMSSGMRPLVSTDGRSGEVCVRGKGREPVLLFVEVQRSHEFSGIPSVSLQYDVEPLPQLDAALLDPMEECRPCTQEELLDAYCTSDFVAVGSISQTRPAGDGDSDGDGDDDQQGLVTHVEVAVAQLVHQNFPVFRRRRREDPHLTGVIHAPARCGVRPASKGGHLLFTGRMRLGKAKLRCAPYLEDWLKVAQLAECVYD
ncbi:meteorin-like [Babylonia areolata]|uniref:meteorin-like n=1 Tax=Babylonia areolata TaxID=304850 RepID=UPI003FD069DB